MNSSVPAAATSPWSGDDLHLSAGARLGGEIAVQIPAAQLPQPMADICAPTGLCRLPRWPSIHWPPGFRQAWIGPDDTSARILN
jgi:hypothetical protein